MSDKPNSLTAEDCNRMANLLCMRRAPYSDADMQDVAVASGLVAENDRLRTDNGRLLWMASDGNAELDRLRERLAAAEVGAARLKYLLWCSAGEWEEFNSMRLSRHAGVDSVIQHIDLKIVAASQKEKTA